jgi:16S rRNA (guanine527-N7)-methyltransferase
MIATEALERGVTALGVSLDESQIAQLERYLAILDKWNRVYNLTAIRERGRMVTHHLLDSLAIVPYVRGPRVLDVGSGAGLPGIPLAIAKRDLLVTLIDSNEKKAAFLQQVIAELHITNAAVRAERVESCRVSMHFDTIVSRAFADLADFVVSSRHLLAQGGKFVAMKGVHANDQVERLPLGFRVRETIDLEVPQLDAERHLVVVEPVA